MEYLQEDPYSSHRGMAPHQDPYYSGGGGHGGYHDNSYERHSEHSYHSDRTRPHHNNSSNYADLPNGGGPHHNTSGIGYPHPEDRLHQAPRDGSYAGSYQGDGPMGSGNYADPYPSSLQYNGGPTDDYGPPGGGGGGHPLNNYSFQSGGGGDPHHGYNDQGHHYPEDDQYPQPEDYREIQNRSTSAVEDPYALYNDGQPPHPNSSFHEPLPQHQQQGGYDPYHDNDRYSDGGPPRSHHSLDHDTSYSRNHSDQPPHPGYQEDHMRGLPPVHQDPFADSPFQPAGQFVEDPYGRGPSPAASRDNRPYSRQSYNDPAQAAPGSDQGHRYDDRAPPYDDQGPVYNDRVGAPPYHDQPGDPYNPEDVPNSYAPPHRQDYPQDYPDAGSNYGSNHPRNLGPPYGDDPNYPPEQEVLQRMDQMSLNAPPPMDGRLTPADDPALPNYYESRHPDLQQVVDFLSSPDDGVKGSAAAYLQHLTYMDDNIKAKTRAMGGIPALIALLSNDNVAVHKVACGALQNLSYGRNNNENKREVKNENGIPELIRLLRKTPHEDVMESVTGVLWNLSSCEDLKKAIIEDGLSVLVSAVISRCVGFNGTMSPWTTVCRNTTGIIRNVSSAGIDARKQLRECKGLVNSLIEILKKAVKDGGRNEIDNKPVENTVCILRNLSYRIQEVVEPEFYKRRTLPRQKNQGGGNSGDKGDVGCFGNKSKAKQGKNSLPKVTSNSPPMLPPLSIEYRALWGSEIHSMYSALLRTCTNPITMEAAAGAIQNLTACDWQPAADSRMMMRKEKGLPLMVDLLSAESDRVVCATATALRNLAIDEKNKELIGKYAIRQLASRLPRDDRSNMPDDTICAIVATLYEVVKDNQDFALALLKENGLPPLMHINNSDRRYLARTLKFTLTLLKTMWTYKPLHSEYAKLKYFQQNFTTSLAQPRQDGPRPPDMSQAPPTSSNHTTPYNTLSRPMSGQGIDDNTLSSNKVHQMHQHQPQSFQSQPPHLPHNSHGIYYGADPRRTTPTPADSFRDLNRSNASIHDQRDDGNYSRGRRQPEEIHMNDFGVGYAPLDEPQPHQNKPPVGGVPLFPTLNNTGGSPSPYPGDNSQGGNEPLYAQVNKGSRRRLDPYNGPDTGSSPGGHHNLDTGGGEPGGVDSWV